MKKNFLFIAAAFSVTMFFSCKKENINNQDAGAGSNSPATRISSETNNSGVYTYKYDAAGQLIVIKKNGSSNLNTTAVLTYSPGKIIQQGYDNGAQTVKYNYELNSDGLVIKETHDDDPDFLETSVYNSDKRLVKITATNNGIPYAKDFFYSNGNCDSVRISYNGVWGSTVKRTYYTDKANTLDNSSIGRSFFASQSKNLVQSEQYCFSDGSTNTKITWTYEFDAAGRVVKRSGAMGGNLEIVYFTY